MPIQTLVPGCCQPKRIGEEAVWGRGAAREKMRGSVRKKRPGPSDGRFEAREALRPCSVAAQRAKKKPGA